MTSPASPAAAHPADAFANVVDEAQQLNPYSTDVALQDALRRQNADWAQAQLYAQGEGLGQPESWHLAELANRHTPELHRFDARGRQVDEVEFHPAWHALMAQYRSHGLIGMPFASTRPGRWSAWAAGFMLHGQIEQGTLCPATMTTAAIPVLQRETSLWTTLQAKLMSPVYDPQDVPIANKRSIWIGMGMTERQGGSDVRANTTLATPLGPEGRGQAYAITGHKWFFSAPMCDAHLVVARTSAQGNYACFFVPRWRFDGTRNAVHVERLKSKVGNSSNASSEVRFDGAWGLLLGEVGRGIPTIIEMATHTRLNCVLGATAIMRQALVQAISFTRQRMAFGKRLAEQPLMQNVLADLALESEAAMTLSMRVARALDHRDNRHEDLLVRLVTAVGKYWICKRTPGHAYEAMECIGGSGVMEDSMFPRLYREAPVNAIWEGSGNIQCLDVLRAMAKTPEVVDAFFAELRHTQGQNTLLDQHVRDLGKEFADPTDLQYRARHVVERMALALQASLLVRGAPAFVADAFCASRLAPEGSFHYGALPRGVDVAAIIERATPRIQ